ncbi:MAG: type II secretion system major pseudopilin GspG [Gammaproteobacteria bacterium]|nr:type II secretion system major pseudopilin GspG [Gammaproteobacteria bacterium]
MQMPLPLPMRRRSGGFTLIEVMIVVVILAILAAIVVPRVMSAPERARVTRAKADIQSITSALNLYKLDNYTYPTAQQGLEALVKKPDTPPIPPNWHQYLSEVPVDPWGQPYKYLFPGTHNEPFDVWTNGPPGAAAAGDESQVIGNWNDGATGKDGGNG